MLFLFKILYNIVQVFSFSSRFSQTGEFRFSPGFMSPCLPPTARNPIQFMSPTGLLKFQVILKHYWKAWYATRMMTR